MSRRQGRRWSLSLTAVLLLHWALGICTAMADVLCLEPDGRVQLEHHDRPCGHDGYSKAEAAGSEHCVDLPVADHHDNHDSLPAHVALPELPPPFLVPALAPASAEPVFTALSLPLLTGPPVASRSVSLRELTVLRI